MPGVQLNYNYFRYTDDNANNWTLRSSEDWGENGASGGAAATGDPAYGRQTVRRAPRKAIYRDPQTFRTFTGPVFTPAAFAALTVGTSTYNVQVPGLVSPVAYTLVKKVPERNPSTVVGRQNPDHS